MKDAKATLKDGRELSYTDIGEPGWPCVFFFHGAPMSRLHLACVEQNFVAERVRVVSPDRPGYGGSSPQPGRSLADWPSDVAALAGALGINRFLVAGHSSGGPYAIACAAQLPQRVAAAIVLSGVTDMGWAGAWEGYGAESERHLMRLPGVAEAIAWCEQRYGADGSGFLNASDFELSEPDNFLVTDEQTGPAITASVAEAFRQGVGGYAQDIVVQGRPWPFDPSRIAVPVHMVHGERDVLIPLAHARHTAERIPGASLTVLPGHGHMTTVAQLPALTLELLARASL